MLAYISANKTEEISVDRAKEMAGSDPDEKNKALVYEYYVEEQKKMYALDFDDLIGLYQLIVAVMALLYTVSRD